PAKRAKSACTRVLRRAMASEEPGSRGDRLRICPGSRASPRSPGTRISELSYDSRNPDKKSQYGIPMRTIARVIETILFQSRWLLAPIYLGLVVCLVLLMVHFGHELFTFVLKIPTAKESDVILGTLSLIDLAFTGNLVVIVIFSGYENFVSKIETAHD